MQEYKLSKRIKNGDRVVSYILTDRSGGHIEVDPDSLKRAVKAGEVKVKGLRLTSDYRLMIVPDEIEIDKSAFSMCKNLDLNSAIQPIFDIGCLRYGMIRGNFYEPAKDSVEDRKRQIKYKKYLSDMRNKIIKIMSQILHSSIEGDTVNATYALVVKKNIADEDHVRYIQGEKAACTAYANAIVQMIKSINKNYNNAVEWAYEQGDPEDDLYYADNDAMYALENLQQCIKIYIKH